MAGRRRNHGLGVFFAFETSRPGSSRVGRYIGFVGGVLWGSLTGNFHRPRKQSPAMSAKMAEAATSVEMGYQLTFSVLPHKLEPCQSFYLVPRWKFMWWFDGIWPCGVEEMTPSCDNIVFFASEEGKIIIYHCEL